MQKAVWGEISGVRLLGLYCNPGKKTTIVRKKEKHTLRRRSSIPHLPAPPAGTIWSPPLCSSLHHQNWWVPQSPHVRHFCTTSGWVPCSAHGCSWPGYIHRIVRIWPGRVPRGGPCTSSSPPTNLYNPPLKRNTNTRNEVTILMDRNHTLIKSNIENSY